MMAWRLANYYENEAGFWEGLNLKQADSLWSVVWTLVCLAYSGEGRSRWLLGVDELDSAILVRIKDPRDLEKAVRDDKAQATLCRSSIFPFLS